MSEYRKSFTGYVILSIGAVVFLLVAAACQITGNEKLPDGARRLLDEEYGRGQYQLVRAEKGSNPEAYQDEVWCIEIVAEHHDPTTYDLVVGNFGVVLDRVGNLWDINSLRSQSKRGWLYVGCSDNTYPNPD